NNSPAVRILLSDLVTRSDQPDRRATSNHCRRIRMKRSVCLGLLAMAAAITALQPSAALAGTRANRPGPLTRAVFAGTATVDQLVARTAARCQCAPAGA